MKHVVVVLMHTSFRENSLLHVFSLNDTHCSLYIFSIAQHYMI